MRNVKMASVYAATIRRLNILGSINAYTAMKCTRVVAVGLIYVAWHGYAWNKAVVIVATRNAPLAIFAIMENAYARALKYALRNPAAQCVCSRNAWRAGASVYSMRLPMHALRRKIKRAFFNRVALVGKRAVALTAYALTANAYVVRNYCPVNPKTMYAYVVYGASVMNECEVRA